MISEFCKLHCYQVIYQNSRMFVIKQIVWAKPKGYPWWPAEISKLPTPDHNFYKVTFIGETNHAHLQQKAIRKYLEYYDTLKTNNYKGLQNSIQIADSQLQKRKNFLLQNTSKLKNSKNGSEKSKKIKKAKNKKKNTFRQNFLIEIKPLNDCLKSFQQDDKDKFQKQLIEQSSAQRPSQGKRRSIKSENQSADLSEQNSSSCQMPLNELEYMRNVDRKKIEQAQEQLFSFITHFNSNIYDRERQCLQLIQRIQKDQFKAQELLQSKITNMITYLHKKLAERNQLVLKKEEIQKINKINHSLKEKVLNFLFDCSYYEQYLKRMEKTIANNQRMLENKQQKQENSTKKYRKYKRKAYPLKKLHQAK